jgi:hypothetical protein
MGALLGALLGFGLSWSNFILKVFKNKHSSLFDHNMSAE